MAKKKYIRRKITKLQSCHEAWPGDALGVLLETIEDYKKRYKYIQFGITTNLKEQYDRHYKRDGISWSGMRVKYISDRPEQVSKFVSEASKQDNYIDNNITFPTTLFDEHPTYYIYILVGKRKKSKNLMNKKKFNVIDLFCGAGGLSKGFIDAGYEVLAGVDFDDAALRTFDKNHNGAKALKLDLFNLDNIQVLVNLLEEKGKQLDVLIGGPPCQGFSLAGKRLESDERNRLYTAMVKTAEIIRPKAILLENVPSILSLYEGKVKERIFEDFEKLGYKMNVQVLYAPDYGIPQIRKRAIFIGLLNSDEKFEYPKPYLKPEEYVTCEQAISDLPTLEGDEDYNPDSVREYPMPPQTAYQKLMRKNSKHIYNHTPTKHAQKTIDAIALVPDGGKYTDLPGDMAKNFKYHESLHRYASNRPSLTIDTGHRTHFHYRLNRIPSARENARLQSFPDDFIFLGNKQQQYKQVGNAVPPLLGQAVATKLLDYLKDE